MAAPKESQPWKLLAGLLAIALAASLVVLAVQDNRREAAQEPPPAPVIAAPAPPKPEPVLTPPPPLTRSDLLGAAALAASAYAAGQEDWPGRDALFTRRFRVSIPFGCFGPSDPKRPPSRAYWTTDGERLRITVRPEDWRNLPVLAGLPSEPAVEAVEGFWLPRPWLSTDACPAVRPGGEPAAATATATTTAPARAPAAAPAAATPETVGLAEVYLEGGSRVGRRDGRPFETTTDLPDDGAPAAPQGFRLVLEGRIAQFPGGSPVRCRSDGPDARPVCVFAVDVEQVAIRDPSRDPAAAPLAEWRD